MLIEPFLAPMLGILLLSSTLATSSTFNIDKHTPVDKKAYEYGLASSVVGFLGVFVVVPMLLYIKLYSKNIKYVTYTLIYLLVTLIVLFSLIYLMYDNLDKGYHSPVGGVKNVTNKTERDLAFVAFIFTIAGVTVGLSYLYSTGIESEFFDKITGGKLNIKKMFTFFEKDKNVPKNRVELDNLLDDLTL
jgi:hypothetical protein